MTDWLDFDLHGLVRLRVAADAPTADQLSIMFRPFTVPFDAAHPADITVTGTVPALEAPSVAEDDFVFTDDAVWVKALGVCIDRQDGCFGVHGRGELLTSVLPLIDRVAVTRDTAMVHAATAELDGHGVCLPAWGGVGKTSTIAKLLARSLARSGAFMGDDWAFVTADHDLLGYRKPLFIKPHHRPIYPHLFRATRKPLVPKPLSRPIARLTTTIHPIATRYPKLAAWSRRWSPEHLMVEPERAFPTATFADRAPLALVMFVERHRGTGVIIDDVDRAWMTARMLGNFYAEMALPSRELLTALGTTSLLSLDVVMAEKAAVLDKALVGIPTLRLRVPEAWSADHASDVIVEFVDRSLACL